ncbi:MAG: MBL fold metallo-hydrolase [Candidatus Pacebacteria bacterium]|nr:MBL fold metallo-hydrolase [Candidatus Paceibacterota bacterium]
MVITFFGEQFLKITKGEFTLAINPVSKNAKNGAIARFGADVALVSTAHPSMNGITEVTHGDTVPFVVQGAGEYEIGGMSIVGIGGVTHIDSKEYINTSYYFKLDDIGVCVLGGIENDKSIEVIREKSGDIDVLFVPLGQYLSPSFASKIAVSLAPSLIIPVAHTGKGDSSLAQFLKENESHEEVDKLTIKKKDCVGRNGDVIVINPSK